LKLIEDLGATLSKLDQIDNDLKWSGRHDLVALTTKAINILVTVEQLLNQEESK
jgi:hypothetical protein